MIKLRTREYSIWWPRLGWEALSPKEAAELGLEQATRFRWEAFNLAWLGYGVMIMARTYGRIGEDAK